MRDRSTAEHGRAWTPLNLRQKEVAVLVPAGDPVAHPCLRWDTGHVALFGRSSDDARAKCFGRLRFEGSGLRRSARADASGLKLLEPAFL